MLALYMPVELQLFQFHKGAIGVTKDNDGFKDFDNFNSIKVRLEWLYQ